MSLIGICLGIEQNPWNFGIPRFVRIQDKIRQKVISNDVEFYRKSEKKPRGVKHPKTTVSDKYRKAMGNMDMTVSEIANATGVTSNCVRDTMNRYERLGLVIRSSVKTGKGGKEGGIRQCFRWIGK